MSVFVSIVVDDLEARQDPDRSARASTYQASTGEIDRALDLVRRFKKLDTSPPQPSEIERIHSLLSGMGYEGSTEKMVDQLVADAVARKDERDKLTKELSEAEARLDLLDALEAAGVDNWSGYSEAMKALGNDDDE